MDPIIIVLLNTILCVAGFVVTIFNYLAIGELRSVKEKDPGPKFAKRSKPASKEAKKKPVCHDEETLWMREIEEKRKN